MSFLTHIGISLALFLAAPAQAGGPLSVCSGVPTKYSGAGSVTLNYDQGNLGSRSKAQADALVTEAVSLWTNVGTATVTLARGTDLAVDVTTANYSTYWGNTSDGLTPVIYDTDGSIIDLLNGVGAKNSILGFAGSIWYSYPDYCQYSEGRAVINGYIAIDDTTMKVVLAHEIGHLIGLDHTQLDSTQGLSAAYPSNYPLMYPIAYRDTVSLHEDDVAAVSALYPDASLSSVYGQLSGTFTQAGGTPIRGANLWAEETTSHQLFSIVSDYLMQNTGYFKLLLPAGNYTLHAEAVQTNFTNGSSVGPYTELSSDPSFQAPLYVGGVAMPPVVLGNATPTQIAIIAGCAATAGFKLDGTGPVSGNCGSTCSYSLSPTSQSAAATGLSGTITVSSTSGCAWTAASNASWVTITSGASGSGNGTVVYSVDANTGTSVRTGTLTIAGQTFTVTQSGSGGGTAINLLVNPGFESGASSWTESSSGGYALITNGASSAHTGNSYAWLGGYNSGTDAIYQNITIPADAQTAAVQFWYRISTTETNTSSANDNLLVDLYSVASGARLATLKALSNLDATTGWVQSAQFDVSAYKGQTVQLRFTATTNSSNSTSFRVDDVSLITSTASSPSSWTALPGASPSRPSLALNSGTGKTQMVVRSVSDQLWMGNFNTSGTFEGWNSLPGASPSALALAWHPTLSKMYMVARSASDQLWLGAFNAAGSFEGWSALPGTSPSAVALAWHPTLNKMYMVARSASDQLWLGAFNAAGSFEGWSALPGTSPSAVALAYHPTLNKMYMVARAANDQLWLGTFNSAGLFEGWSSLPASASPSPVALAWHPTLNKMYLVARSASDQLWQGTFNSTSGAFEGWSALSGTSPTAPVLAAGQNTLQLMVRSANDQLWSMLLQ